MINMRWKIINGEKVLQYKYKIGNSIVRIEGAHGATTSNKVVYSSWQIVKEPEQE